MPVPRGCTHLLMVRDSFPSRPLAGRVDRMSEANAGGVGGLFLLRASKVPPPGSLRSPPSPPTGGRVPPSRCVDPLALQRRSERPRAGEPNRVLFRHVGAVAAPGHPVHHEA